MRIFSVMGSPRLKGNTVLVLDNFMKGMREGHDQLELKSVFLHGKKIEPCAGCNKCKTDSESCVIGDDMLDLYGEVVAADVIIFSTPIYWWNMSAQLKTFLDRLYALDYEKAFKGKKFVLLMTYGGEDPNSGAEIVEKSMREICDFVSMEFSVSFGMCSELSEDERKEALIKVYNLGFDL